MARTYGRFHAAVLTGLPKTKSKPVNPIKRDRAIVLPLRPSKGVSYTGVGLGLHFLLGNVLVLCSRLEEMWFGWRANRIFPDSRSLTAYCRNHKADLNLFELGVNQKIRYWFSGVCTDREIEMEIADTLEDTQLRTQTIFLQIEDHLVGFRKVFMRWISGCGIFFDASQRVAALWPEKISLEGLDAVGRALETFYMFSFKESGAALDINPFAEAVSMCPSSFLAQDLLGWAHYRRGEYDLASHAFLRALRENHSGIGAMAGLMWCAVRTQDEKNARYWSGQKAEIRKEDVGLAREKAFTLMKKQR